MQNGSLGIDAASTAALGGVQKAVMGSKAFLNTRFVKNLSEEFKTARGTVANICERALKSNDGFLRLGKPVTAEARATGAAGTKGSLPARDKHLFTGRVRSTTGPGKTEPLLRRGENPSARPTWRQSEIDDMLRLKTDGQIVESQVSFLNGERCGYGASGSIRVDNLVDGRIAYEMKNYDSQAMLMVLYVML